MPPSTAHSSLKNSFAPAVIQAGGDELFDDDLGEFPVDVHNDFEIKQIIGDLSTHDAPDISEQDKYPSGLDLDFNQ